MKRFLLLHIGFEQPTPELMGRWKVWFESIAPHTVENVGLRTAREISKDGVAELAWGRDSLTGYTIITAEDMDAAEAMARSNPFITSIRIYELAA